MRTRLVPLLFIASICLFLLNNTRAADPTPLTQEDILSMVDELSNWGRWGADDQVGAINLITPKKRRQAAKLVRKGISVSLARDVETEPAADNPNPFHHTMLSDGQNLHAQWCSDNYSVSYHGFAHSHIDSLCHYVHRQTLYNGFSSKTARELKRWDFLLTVAPLPVNGGTGSPLNPIATF